MGMLHEPGIGEIASLSINSGRSPPGTTIGAAIAVPKKRAKSGIMTELKRMMNGDVR
jgi:hypothetical protein